MNKNKLIDISLVNEDKIIDISLTIATAISTIFWLFICFSVSDSIASSLGLFLAINIITLFMASVAIILPVTIIILLTIYTINIASKGSFIPKLASNKHLASLNPEEFTKHIAKAIIGVLLICAIISLF